MLKMIAGWPWPHSPPSRDRPQHKISAWPNRPVTLVVPYAAGGPVDTIARIIAARLSEILGQQMVIENVGGAGGLTGTVRVAKAAPDGYTLLLSGSAVLSQNPTLPQAIALRPDRRFRPCRAVLGFGARADRTQGFPAERLQGVHGLREGRTRTRCNTARRARAPAATPAPSCSTARWAPRSPTCPTAAPAPPCRTCSAAASTTCSSRFRPPRRRSRPAP